jgi:translation elongation factor EF-Ts
MSDELFEVAFSGQVSDIAELDNVKARVGKIFNTDAAKVVQLFSGKRVVIKKNIDRLTAEKYQHALTKAGAIAEVKLMVVEGFVDTATQPVMTKVALQPNQHTTLKIDQSSHWALRVIKFQI